MVVTETGGLCYRNKPHGIRMVVSIKMWAELSTSTARNKGDDSAIELRLPGQNILPLFE